MPFVKFEDFDKEANDLFDEDFKSGYTLKIKTPGVLGVTPTTNTTFNFSDKKKGLSNKVSFKYAHPSGFTIDKFEFENDGTINTESSLKDAAPGLKLDFKGSDKKVEKKGEAGVFEPPKGELGFTYETPKFTATGIIDIIGRSKATFTALGGNGPFTVGASIGLKNCPKDGLGLGCTTLGVGYTLAKQLFCGVRIKNLTCSNSRGYSGLLTYLPRSDVTIAAKATSDNTFGVGVNYKCNPNTTVKFKAMSCGALSASVKQDVAKNFSVVGNASKGSDGAIAFGVAATLG